MSIRSLLCLLLFAGGSLGGAELPEPSPEKLPRWRGFNLLEKLDRDTPRWNRPFVEDDFRWISELGFNFVRLPMDYRLWIKNKDWEQIDEAAFRDIDQAVAWGRQYGLHVSLAFHRAPGFKIADRTEPRDLWTDPIAQRVCAQHWAFFANRYRGISNRNLSFNLVNEPPNLDPQVYLQVVTLLVNAIRKEDPERLIIADGLRSGNIPVPLLQSLRITQATRGYQPVRISHYGATWIPGANRWPLPTQWPVNDPHPYLFGQIKRQWQGPLTLRGTFPAGTRVRIHVDAVSVLAELQIRADGKTVWEQELVPGPGEGDWKKVVYDEKHKTYQNIYDRDYMVELPAAASVIELGLGKGDWLRYTEVGITLPNKNESVLKSYGEGFGAKPGTLELDDNGTLLIRNYPATPADSTLEAVMKPWKQLSDGGTGVMIGEWGAYNRTPHAVALSWMEECLDRWREAGWGWALWNFRGSFGILDSERSDVSYENFHGHRLDRAMLDLLQRE